MATHANTGGGFSKEKKLRIEYISCAIQLSRLVSPQGCTKRCTIVTFHHVSALCVPDSKGLVYSSPSGSIAPFVLSTSPTVVETSLMRTTTRAKHNSLLLGAHIVNYPTPFLPCIYKYTQGLSSAGFVSHCLSYQVFTAICLRETPHNNNG